MATSVASIAAEFNLDHEIGTPYIPSCYIDSRDTHVPDIIEFCLSDRYLNKETLYPRQATLLKTIFLQDELYTDYDYDVLDEWVSAWKFPEISPDQTTGYWGGDWGISPDVLDRMKILKDEGNRWFNIMLAVQGRRSGKGYIGGICAAYVLWHYICSGDPQKVYGIERTKRLATQVFAGKKEQATKNQWGDIANTIMGAPIFDPFANKSLGESMTLLAPADRPRAREWISRGRDSAMDISTFEIVPKEATTMASRGPASIMLFFDEMAHMVNTGVSRSAGDVYDSAEPSLRQVGVDSFTYCGSSPWTMQGKFYELVQEGLEIDAVTKAPMNPNILLLQLSSWDIYLDYERTQEGLVASPRYQPKGGVDSEGRPWYKPVKPVRYFPELKKPIMSYDRHARQLERLNPSKFRVEYRAKWETALDAYLPGEHVDRMFQAPWDGILLEQKEVGNPGGYDYVAHGDPGKVGSNFAFGIAHLVPDPAGSSIPYVIFDRVHAWTPGDFPTTNDSGEIVYEMDYIKIGQDLGEMAENFLFTDLSFDQWQSINFIQTLRNRLGKVSYKRFQVWERTATHALNWATAETFKIALALGRVRAPYYELAELECKFLQKLPGDKVDHPTTGPCTTKDVYDVLSIVTYKLIGREIAAAYGEDFAALRVGAAMPGHDAVSTGRAEGQGMGRPIAESAVHSMFQRDRGGRAGERPRPGENPGRQRPETRR